MGAQNLDPVREALAKSELKAAFDKALFGWVMTSAPASLFLYSVRAFRDEVHEKIDALVGGGYE